MTQAHLQLPVHANSKPLLLINTQRVFTQLPYGVLVAPAVARYLDDILIATPTESEHNLILEQVLQTLKESGIHLCINACLANSRLITYLAHRIDAIGIHPTMN